jgi:hypothetical protein
VEILAHHASREIKDLAPLILEVARVKPHKRRRWKFLAQNHSELFLRLKALSGDDIPEADLSSLITRAKTRSLWLPDTPTSWKRTIGKPRAR